MLRNIPRSKRKSIQLKTTNVVSNVTISKTKPKLTHKSLCSICCIGCIMMVVILLSLYYKSFCGDAQISTLIASGDYNILYDRFKFEVQQLPFECILDLSNKNQLHEMNITTHIPKNIFQTWTTHQSSDCRASKLIELNPNYDYYLYNDTEINYFFNIIMKNEFDGNLTTSYNMINPNNGAAKADLFRLAILWKYGGIYLDLDAVCFIPFDDIINGNIDAVMSSAWYVDDLHNFTSINAVHWEFMFKPKHKILNEAIKLITNNILSKENQIKYNLFSTNIDMDYVTKHVTGPAAFTNAVRKAIKKYNLIENTDFTFYGHIWNGRCKHYHSQKGFYKSINVVRYNHMKKTAFLQKSII